MVQLVLTNQTALKAVVNALNVNWHCQRYLLVVSAVSINTVQLTIGQFDHCLENTVTAFVRSFASLSSWQISCLCNQLQLWLYLSNDRPIRVVGMSEFSPYQLMIYLATSWHTVLYSVRIEGCKRQQVKNTAV